VSETNVVVLKTHFMLRICYRSEMVLKILT